MTCSKEFSIEIEPSYPWNTLVWDQQDGYAGFNGGSYESAGDGTFWAGQAFGGDLEISAAAGHAIGSYNGPLLNCLVTFNLINPPANPALGAGFNILQNGSSRISKNYSLGEIVPGVNVYAFTLLNTGGLTRTIEVQGSMGIGPPINKNNVFVAAALTTLTRATINVELA